jgi:hypothetical protein
MKYFIFIAKTTIFKGNMIRTMDNNLDLKSLSLQLFGKEVVISIKEDSSTYKLYNTASLKGILVGRLWGEMITRQNRQEETVVAITIRRQDMDLEIPCKDIISLQ